MVNNNKAKIYRMGAAFAGAAGIICNVPFISMPTLGITGSIARDLFKTYRLLTLKAISLEKGRDRLPRTDHHSPPRPIDQSMKALGLYMNQRPALRRKLEGLVR